jgi:tetratricopeptide (TPR) repeat protein
VSRTLVVSTAASSLLAALVSAAQPPAAAPPSVAPPAEVIAVSTSNARNFETLWSDYQKATDAGDQDARTKALLSIRWYRVERNIRSLDSVALALVARGVGQLKKGNPTKAEEEFRNAILLDPNLPDARFGLGKAEIAKGPVGIMSALDDLVAGALARLPTAAFRYDLVALVVCVGLVALLAAGAAFAFAVLLRHGALLVHDIEESMGLGSRVAATGVFMVFLMVPLMTLNGYGWLPLWWLALLFVYMTRTEQVLTALLLAATLLVAPSAQLVDGYLNAQQNPLLRASLRSIESGPDARSVAELQAAVEKYPGDKDLKYLLALQHKKAGRYEAASAVYEALRAADANDGVAINNRANVLFAEDAASTYKAAQALYQQATRLGSSSKTQTATYYYNLSLAHLQAFEYEASHAARSSADELDRGLTAGYEKMWREEKGGSVVATAVDLALTGDEVWGKFVGVRDGVARENNMGKGGGLLDPVSPLSFVFNRFFAFIAVFAGAGAALSWWRGNRAFTLRCQKCGTPFCRKCQLTAAVTGLCTQCHHIFVVRDGVSGPARNQKLMEVQKEEDRRNRVYRILSLLSPGAGQVYGQKALLGVPLALLWYGLIAILVLRGRLVTLTDTPSLLVGPWGAILAGLLMLIVWVLANRLRPDFDFDIPVQPRTARRMPKAS